MAPTKETDYAVWQCTGCKLVCTLLIEGDNSGEFSATKGSDCCPVFSVTKCCWTQLSETED